MAIALAIFLFSLALNFLFRFLTPSFGAYRRGLDTVLYCSIATGYVGGSDSGLLYGGLIAFSYYLFRSRQFDYAVFVIPLAALTGAIAGMFSMQEFMTVGLGLFLFYHIISATVVMLYRYIALQYLSFVGMNFITTFLLLRITDLFV